MSCSLRNFLRKLITYYIIIIEMHKLTASLQSWDWDYLLQRKLFKVVQLQQSNFLIQSVYIVYIIFNLNISKKNYCKYSFVLTSACINMNIFRIGYPQTLQSVSNRSYFSLVFSLNASQTNGVPYLASGIISLLVFIHVLNNHQI